MSTSFQTWSHEGKDPVNLARHIISSSWFSTYYLVSTQKLVKYVLTQQESWHSDSKLHLLPSTLRDLGVEGSLGSRGWSED